MVILAAIGERAESKRVIQVAYDLADAYDDSLAVVHVIPDHDAEKHLAALREIPEYEATTLVDELDRASEFAASMVEAALGRVPGDQIATVGRVGDPADQILAVADERDARYVVVGARKRSPVGKAVFGSTTQSVLLTAEQPVVTVLGDSPG